MPNAQSNLPVPSKKRRSPFGRIGLSNALCRSTATAPFLLSSAIQSRRLTRSLKRFHKIHQRSCSLRVSADKIAAITKPAGKVRGSKKEIRWVGDSRRSSTICVSTQVVEAGMDISAHRLWSEIAPWGSVVQRLGRLNRDGQDQEAKAIFWSSDKLTKKKGERIGPYIGEDIAAAQDLIEALVPESKEKSAREALGVLKAKGKAKLEESLAPKLATPPRAIDVHGLFSTERDLFGGFTDISAFVRGTYLMLMSPLWRTWPGKFAPRDDELPARISIRGSCGSPLWSVAALSQGGPASRLDVERRRRSLGAHESRRYSPRYAAHPPSAAAAMLSSGMGGNSADKLDGLRPPGRGRALRDDVRTEAGYWGDLAGHLTDARREAQRLCRALGLDDELSRGVIAADNHHDIGKAHPHWQQALPTRDAGPHELLAKSPDAFGVEVEQRLSQEVVKSMVGQIARLLGPAERLSDEIRERQSRLRLRWAVERDRQTRSSNRYASCPCELGGESRSAPVCGTRPRPHWPCGTATLGPGENRSLHSPFTLPPAITERSARYCGHVTDRRRRVRRASIVQAA